MKSPSLQTYTSHNLTVVNWLDELWTAYAVMRDKGVRHLPVVDDRGLIIGIISDRDFQRAMQVSQAEFGSGKVADFEFDPNSTVSDFMSWPVESIDEDCPLSEAAHLMIDKKISALLVTRNAQVYGIVTSEDLLRALVELIERPTHGVKESVLEFAYTSPVGQIASVVANAGI